MSAYSLPDGKTLHRWTNNAGEMWACAEYDHGPLCRRCVPVNPTMDLCLQNVVDGLFEIVKQIPGKDFRLRLTEEGNRRAAVARAALTGEGTDQDEPSDGRDLRGGRLL